MVVDASIKVNEAFERLNISWNQTLCLCHPCHPLIPHTPIILHSHYETTKAILSSENHNRHRLQHHAHLIFNDALPLLLVLEEEVREDQALVQWLQDVSIRFLDLTTHIFDVEAEAGDEG